MLPNPFHWPEGTRTKHIAESPIFGGRPDSVGRNFEKDDRDGRAYWVSRDPNFAISPLSR
jgi:hypothetical protein